MSYRLCNIYGIEVALPITEGALYGDAYHGTTISRGQSIDRSGFKKGQEGWYGRGAYFWLGDLPAAIWFARRVRGWLTNWAVVQAVVDSGQTLNVEQLWDNKDIRRAVEDSNWADVREKGWSSAHVRSHVALLCLRACAEAGVRIDSIFYFEPLKDLGRPVRALCVKSLGNIKKHCMLRREDIPWRLGEDE